MCLNVQTFLSVHSDKEQLMKYTPGPIRQVKHVNVVMCIVLQQCLFITPWHHLIQSSENSTRCKGRQTIYIYKKVLQAILTSYESYFKYRSMWWDDKIWIFYRYYHSLCSLAPNSWTARNTGPSRRKMRKGDQRSQDGVIKVQCVKCVVIYGIYLNIHENKNKNNVVSLPTKWLHIQNNIHRAKMVLAWL